MMDKLSPIQPKNIRFQLPEDHIPAWHLTDWTNKEKVRKELQRLKNEMQAPNIRVTASLLLKRVMPVFSWAISMHFLTNKLYNLPQANLYFASRWDSDKWVPTLHVTNCPVHTVKEEWTARKLVVEFILPFVEVLASTAKVSKKILLENVYIALRKLFTEDGPKKMPNQVDWKKEWQQICHMRSFSFYHDDESRLFSTGEVYRVRQTCCMKCKLPDSKKCKTCPMLGC